MTRAILRITLLALTSLPLLVSGCATPDDDGDVAQTDDNYVSERDERAIAAIRAAVADTSLEHVEFTVCDTADGDAEPSEGACHPASLDEIPAPDDYPRPNVEGFSLGGTEFWQRWSGGESPTFSYDAGTDFGRRCMTAAALRFEAIMSDPPEEIVALRDQSNWSGSFFNWVDDYSHESAYSDASGARLWAWRTSLMKWISQTAKDGSCFLPTREMVVEAAVSCLARAEANDGETQGCRAD